MHDVSILKGELEQESFDVFVAAVQERGVLKVTVNNANNGGLLSAIDGLPAFLPFSLVSKRVGKSFITLEVCSSAYVCIM